MSTMLLALLVGLGADAVPGISPEEGRKIQAVIDQVDRACRERTVYMLGPEKAKRLAELVRQTKPAVVVECGTAIGYSGLWIARELKAAGSGRLITIEIRLITIEIRSENAREAEANFRQAGLADLITIKIGDARQICRELEGPIDFAFIDCNGANYYPCFEGLEKKLRPGATVVADNAGVSARSMADYLEHVRRTYQSRTEWFDLQIPWAQRDAMEITVIRPKAE